MAAVRQWFGARRLLLKARYAGERARSRVGLVLARETGSVPLDDIHRRLELVLAAAYGRPIPIAAIEERGWVRIRLRRLLPFLQTEESPVVEDDTIKLPARLKTRGERRHATERYRLLAIEQAERITRGTLDHATISDPLERDLYLLREAAAIDARIARAYPGMHDAMEVERTTALSRRPKPGTMTPSERGVEALVVRTLNTPPAELDDVPSDPGASLEWARQTAEEIRRSGGIYRGVPLAPAWGAVRTTARNDRQSPDQQRSALQGNRPSGAASKAETEESSSQSTAPDENSHDDEKRPDEEGKQGESGATAERSNPESAESRDSNGAGTPSPSDDASSPRANLDTGGLRRDDWGESTADLPSPIYYDEWNAERGVYLRAGAAVRLYDAASASPTWLREELQKQAATARQIRHQFERLRARRSLLLRQPRGDMLDLAACVEAMTARRMGVAPDDRLYVDARPARRGIAISLLIDASGSTSARVSGDWRIIDIEKIALLLATQALDTLGDLYAIYAFAGRTASNVKVTVVKDFTESNGEEVTRRIAALNPEGFTRLGAAVRHATHELARQTAGHRLLLLLSDGRPNDADGYEDAYGVEDSRQAILEARASGVYPYCLTIDRDASEYLPRIFGKSGHTVLEKPEQLPKALVAVVRGLIRR